MFWAKINSNVIFALLSANAYYYAFPSFLLLLFFPSEVLSELTC